jgi:ubiquitin C-terminal hydrolase
MGKIEAINSMTDEIVEAVERNLNKMSISSNDLHFLTDKYNLVNTHSFRYKDVDACSDCRRTVFNFWKYAVEQWKKNINI